MRLLAFDTSMQACSAAVLIAEGTREISLHARFEPMEQGHAERLLPMIAEVLAGASLGMNDLDRIAVTRGPGSFTGVRIGVATARGLALASQVDLVGAGTLEVIAADCRARHCVEPEQLLCIAIDARRGQLYCQLFGAPSAFTDAPLALSPAEAAQLLPTDRHLHIFGSGASLLQDALTAAGRSATHLDPCAGVQTLPRAEALARLAIHLPKQTAPLRPLYLRPPDAKAQTGYAVERREDRSRA